MKLQEFKQIFIKIVIGSLIAAALLVVLTILLGSFNEILGKALFTLVLVVAHALASLGFIDRTAKLNTNESLKVFTNVTFGILVLSFFTSLLGTWELLAGEVVFKLYLTYFVFLFATLHGEMLAKTLHKKSYIDNIVYSNFVFMAVVIFLILPLIWFTSFDFGDLYYRVLAANGVVDATLTILAVIFHKLYLQKHPEDMSFTFPAAVQYDANGQPIPIRVEAVHKHTNPLLILLGIYIFGQFFIWIVFSIFGRMYR